MSDLKPKSQVEFSGGESLDATLASLLMKRLRSKSLGRDLKLSDLGGYVFASQRQLQRWAATGNIPGAYRLKKGHYRIRLCEKLCCWIVQQRVSVSTGLTPGQHSRALMAWKNAHRRIALETRGGMRGLFGKNPDSLWFEPLEALPRDYFTAKGMPREVAVTAAWSELNARGEKITATTIAKELGMSRATFCRKGYSSILKRLTKSLADNAVVEKDPRAKRLYKNQTLQEIENED
jgi:AraC-like DNA-binding protein